MTLINPQFDPPQHLSLGRISTPDLINAPVLEVVAECHDAHLVGDVEGARPVEAEHRLEGEGVPVEEVLVVAEAVGVAQTEDLGLGGSVHQRAQPARRAQYIPPNLKRARGFVFNFTRI